MDEMNRETNGYSRNQDGFEQETPKTKPIQHSIPMSDTNMQSGWNSNRFEQENGNVQDDRSGSPDIQERETIQNGWNQKPFIQQDVDMHSDLNHIPPVQQGDVVQNGWNIEQSLQKTPFQMPVREGKMGEHSYHTYEEWQQANAKNKHTKREHKSHKKAFCIAGGIVAACVIFVGGAFVGSAILNGQNPSGESASSAQAVINENPNTPTLSISKTEETNTGSMSGEQIYEKVSPSVVSIVSTSLTSSGTSSGSGVVMTKDGYVITNAHVIEGADKVQVITADGMQYTAQVIGSDTKTDLAVLKISANANVTFTPAEFGDSTNLKAGEKAYAIGSPGGVELANSITTGSISAINRDITIDDRVMTLIQTDASINPGNSGGALINQYGQVIGITSAKLGISYYEGLGFAIPIDTAKEIVEQLIAYGYVPGRPAIGVTGYNLGEQTATYNNVPQGVLITEVDSRSDAAKQGLQAKDIITGVNGKTVTTMDEINAEKERLQAGDKMTLTVYRISTGKTMDITITLSDENDLSSNKSTVTTTPDDSQNGQYNSGDEGNAFTFPWGY